MTHRTTIMLDDEAQQAVRDVANRLRVSHSEVIRQAVVRYRDTLMGLPAGARERRKAAFARLIEMFDGRDPEAELRAMRSEDGF